MALAVASGLAHFDMVGIREDLSDLVSDILLADTNLLSRVGIAGEATNTTHSWLEDALNATTVTDEEALDAAGTTVDFDVLTGQGARTRVGTLLRSRTKGKTEVLQVTAVTTDNLTITRGYGSTSAEAHASGTIWDIVGNPKQSGADASDDVSTTRSRVSNFCQIFERGIKIAGDAQAVTKAGIPDEVAHQSAQRLMELMVELDMTLIKGIVSASDGSDTVYRTAKGLIEFLSASGGNSNTTAEEVNPDVINAMYTQAFDDGGDPDVLVVNQTQMKKISKFDADKVRTIPGTRLAGSFVAQFMTDLGKVLDIIVDRHMPPDTIMVLDTPRIAAVPLSSRGFGIEPIAKTGDSFKRQVLGDYTVECRNALKAHAIHSNLST